MELRQDIPRPRRLLLGIPKDKGYLALKKAAIGFSGTEPHVLDEGPFVVLPDDSLSLFFAEVVTIKEESHPPVDLICWRGSSAFHELELVNPGVDALPHVHLFHLIGPLPGSKSSGPMGSGGSSYALVLKIVTPVHW